jgi:hypothetical protein
MVLVYLNGGIGNLLFKYAAGFGLASKLNVPFKLDKSYYHNKSYAGDKLSDFYHIPYYTNILENTFNISAVESAESELDPFRHSLLKKIIERLKPYYKRKIFREQKFGFDPNFFKAPSDVLIKGYWQSEKYFIHVSSMLKKELTFKKSIQEKNKPLVDQIMREISVSLHIRRGDYLKQPVSKNILGTLPMEYYQESVNYLRSVINSNIHFYIFSDDIEWAKNNLHISGNITFIDKSFNLTDVDEMYLMSQCHHNIIANSSFSWWGAWLNKNDNKIVIAPNKWFNNEPQNTQDLIPSNWIRV